MTTLQNAIQLAKKAWSKMTKEQKGTLLFADIVSFYAKKIALKNARIQAFQAGNKKEWFRLYVLDVVGLDIAEKLTNRQAVYNVVLDFMYELGLKMTQKNAGVLKNLRDLCYAGANEGVCTEEIAGAVHLEWTFAINH